MKKRLNVQMKAQKVNLVQAIREVFKEFCSNSSIHGIRYLTERKQHWTERLWWTVAIVLSILLCITSIFEIWRRWHENPVAYAIAQKDAFISSIPFPTVFICPETKITREKLDLITIYRVLNERRTSLSDIELMRLETLLHVCDIQQAEFANISEKFTNHSIYDAIKEIAPPFNRMFRNCSWKSKVYDCANLFKPIWTNEGYCFAFNALNSQDVYTNEMAREMMTTTTNPDVTNWSHEHGYGRVSEDDYPIRMFNAKENHALILYLGLFKSDLDNLCHGRIKGFRVILGEPNETANIRRRTFRVALLEQVEILIKPKWVTTSDGLRSYLPNRRGCYFDSEQHLRFFKHYTMHNCMEECLANFTLKQCDCVQFSMPRQHGTKICGAASVQCYRDAEKKLYGEDIEEGLTDNEARTFRRACDCLPACTAIIYDGDIDRSRFDWDTFMNYYNDAVVDDFESVQPTKLSISFMKYSVETLKRSELYTYTHFLAICGGLLGLFLGISQLSIIEFIYYSTLHLYWTLRSWKSKIIIEPFNRNTVNVLNCNKNEVNANLEHVLDDMRKVRSSKH